MKIQHGESMTSSQYRSVHNGISPKAGPRSYSHQVWTQYMHHRDQDIYLASILNMCTPRYFLQPAKQNLDDDSNCDENRNSVRDRRLVRLKCPQLQVVNGLAIAIDRMRLHHCPVPIPTRIAYREK